MQRLDLFFQNGINLSIDEHGNIVMNDNLKKATTFNNHFVTQFTQENRDVLRKRR